MSHGDTEKEAGRKRTPGAKRRKTALPACFSVSLCLCGSKPSLPVPLEIAVRESYSRQAGEAAQAVKLGLQAFAAGGGAAPALFHPQGVIGTAPGWALV